MTEAVVAPIGIENLKAEVLAGLKTYKAIVAARADGKIDANDLGLVLGLVPDYLKAIQGIPSVIPEFKDLSVAESEELIAFCMAGLGETVSPLWINRISKVVAAVKADYEAVRAFI